jgi:hypothetical protein
VLKKKKIGKKMEKRGKGRQKDAKKCKERKRIGANYQK